MKSQLSNKHLVCVTWDDAHITLDEYNQGEVERDFHGPCKVNTFGLLVADDQAGVTLAMQEGLEDGKFRHLNFIPRGMIVAVVDLGPPRQKTKRKKKEVTHDE
jgi:hypothetical protein